MGNRRRSSQGGRIDLGKLIAALTSIVAGMVVLILQKPLKDSASLADVKIYNKMAGNHTVAVNCESFGERPLAYGEHLGWSFKPSIWGNTKSSCAFRWGSKVHEFYVWVDHGLWGTVRVRPCTHCVWTVRRKGFYRNSDSGHGHGSPIFQYEWA